MGKKKEARLAKKAKAGTVERLERRDVAYADELVNYLQAQAGGSTAFQSAIETAAVEACAGAYSTGVCFGAGVPGR